MATIPVFALFLLTNVVVVFGAESPQPNTTVVSSSPAPAPTPVIVGGVAEGGKVALTPATQGASNDTTHMGREHTFEQLPSPVDNSTTQTNYSIVNDGKPLDAPPDVDLSKYVISEKNDNKKSVPKKSAIPNDMAVSSETVSVPDGAKNINVTAASNATVSTTSSSTTTSTISSTSTTTTANPTTTTKTTTKSPTTTTTTKSPTTKSTTTETPKPKKPTITEADESADSPPTSSNSKQSEIPSIEYMTEKRKQKKADYIVPIVAVILSVPLVAIIISVLYKRGSDWWQHRHYRRMDFLIDGMYNN